jgi:hypothetical protein
MGHRNVIRKGKPEIVVSKFGDVKSHQIDYILGIMRECYGRLEPHETTLLDIYFFEKSSSMDAFMAKESKEVGVVSASFDDLFFAMHDAYRGTSRIIICLERMKNLPKLVQVGGIRHEVGHSVLHGSLLHYLFPLPRALSDLVSRFNISKEYAINLLYLVSIAVKDYEVSRLLYERGYVEDQIAYARYMLTVTPNDKLFWKISRGRPSAEILCLVSCLKAAGCAIPLMFDKIFSENIKRLLTENLSYLPKEYSIRLLKMILKGFPSLGTDTLSNINRMVFLVLENIAKPLLLKSET